MIYIGVEAGSDETLEAINKGGRQTIDLGIEWARRKYSYGLVPEMSFAIGCPPEPDEDIDCAFRYIRLLKEVNEDTEIIIYPYSPVPVDGGS